jgi:hypothetical protein
MFATREFLGRDFFAPFRFDVRCFVAMAAATSESIRLTEMPSLCRTIVRRIATRRPSVKVTRGRAIEPTSTTINTAD